MRSSEEGDSAKPLDNKGLTKLHFVIYWFLLSILRVQVLHRPVEVTLEFSSDGGTTFTYAPTANGLGCDPAITDIRILPQGIFAADTGSGPPQAEFTFRALVN